MGEPLFFDSGIGGLSILRAYRNLYPEAGALYLGDQAHVPYGERPLETVRAYIRAVARFAVEKGAGCLVLACHTASAAALHEMRAEFQALPIVGMEPAIKPAAQETARGVVGILATTATFQSRLFASVVERFAEGVEVIQQPCPGLVEEIEAGETDSPRLRAMLKGWLDPMRARGIDRLVLGCTHYPLIRPLIAEIAGEGVTVIDPASAVARQTRKILTSAPPGPASRGLQVFTTGDPIRFRGQIERWLDVAPDQLTPLIWREGELSPKEES